MLIGKRSSLVPLSGPSMDSPESCTHKALRLMVPPGHVVSDQCSLIPEDQGFAVYPPVMHETGKAEGSPSD